MYPVARYPLASVVIPAHDEENVLGLTLRALLRGAEPGELDIVVVANGCRDRTADVARRAGVRVVETPIPGKAHAIRLGDEACTAFPRAYLDADVKLGAEDLRRLVAALDDPATLASAPVPELDMAGVRPLARRVHRVHRLLISPRRPMTGAGVYVVSGAGHDRAFPVPDVISDDGWVDRSFARHERRVVDTARSTVRPARTVSAILQRRARVRSGNRQLVRLGKPDLSGPLRLGSLLALRRHQEVSVPDALAYLAVVVADRAVTAWRSARGREHEWWSDRTSRGSAAIEAAP